MAKAFGPMNNNYLGMSNSALIALSVIGVWKFAGYYMLFFLAGLQSIPASAREAALMEGASRTQVFLLHHAAAAATDDKLCGDHCADLLHYPN